ncbi:transcription termination factor MTERF2, chloroplastic-like [Gastrolobium bilobum]|uniref:transcription termination factor MTERF2, chloroplastic-like n=1 Tax=Gastrolobium bilobum TaxID=150636 RepID=UPI002AB0826B|nr:transcription termination factor MTERF2, chloroplastic-like [Gastrolobium bilobum]
MIPNFLISRLTASSFTYSKSTQTQLGYLLQHNACHSFFNSFTSRTSSDCESDRNPQKGDTFTISYLINSCGLSPELARERSRRVNLKNPDGPNVVLDLLRNYGFSKAQITKLVGKCPLVLVSKAGTTLLPKLKFFHSIGVSTNDMPKILICNYNLLTSSLKKCLIPRYEIIRSVVRDDWEVVRALRNSPRNFTFSYLMNDFIPNIKVLRQCSVPQASISLLIVNFPSAAYAKHSKFVEAVKTVKDIGCNPLKRTFVMAVQVLLTMSKAAWESRFEVYERWGWNREMTLGAFRKFPNFMKLSEETITKKMSFIVKNMVWPSEDIAKYPSVLSYSLEKRITPRLSVIKILKLKCLVENNLQLSSFMCRTEEKFLKRFVINFQEDVPLLPDVYKGISRYSTEEE